MIAKHLLLTTAQGLRLRLGPSDRRASRVYLYTSGEAWSMLYLSKLPYLCHNSDIYDTGFALGPWAVDV